MDDNYLQYIQQDYTSQRTVLINRLKQRWPGDWSDFSQNSIGMALVDLIAWNTSTMAYTVNSYLNESYVSSARLRESAVRIGNLYLYRLRGPTAAKVQCLAELSGVQQSDVTVSSGTLITAKADDGTTLPFELLNDVVIPAGKLSPESVKATIVYGGSYTGSSTEIVSKVQLTNGSMYADCSNTSTDLSTLVSAGDDLYYSGTYYGIASVSSQPGTDSKNRIVLSEAFSGDTVTATNVTIYDRRSTFVQGQTVTDNYTVPDVPGDNWVITLSRSNVLEGSVSVSVDGTAWTLSDGFSSDMKNNCCVLRLLPTGKYVVQFGSSYWGSVPGGGGSVIVTYRIGFGSIGNVQENVIQSVVKGSTPSGQYVSVGITNPTQASGGQDEESVDEARSSIPSHIMANRRAVTCADYAKLATSYYDQTYGKLLNAVATTGSNENSYINGNVVTVYCWYSNADGIAPEVPLDLQRSVSSYLQERCVGTDIVVVANGSVRPLPVAVLIKVLSGYSQSTVEAAVLSAISTYLASLNPGDVLYQQEILSVIVKVNGVDQVSLITPTSDMAPATNKEMWISSQTSGWQILDYMDSSANSDGSTTMVYQLPVCPVSCWSINIRQESGGVSKSMLQLYPLDGSQAVIIPTSTNGLQSGRLNILTGKLTLTYSGSTVYDISYALTPVSSYSSVKYVDTWITYSGIINKSKRAEIRSSLQAWIHNFGPGYTLYSKQVDDQLASLSNVTSVVKGISGVDDVTSVSFESPQNSKISVTSTSSELIQLRHIFVSGTLD